MSVRMGPHPQELIRHGRSTAEKWDLEEIVVFAQSGMFLLRAEHPSSLTGRPWMGRAQALLSTPGIAVRRIAGTKDSLAGSPSFRQDDQSCS